MSNTENQLNNVRDPRGRFLPGNPGGPGRPPRAIERDYLSMAADTVTPEQWQTLVENALEDAKSGDAKARDWISRICLGAKPPSLKEVATKEALGISSADEIEAEKEREAHFAQVVEHYNGLMDRIRGLAEDSPGSGNGASASGPEDEPGPMGDVNGHHPDNTRRKNQAPWSGGDGQRDDGRGFSTD